MRVAAVQALYQMDIAGTGLNDILAEFESHWIGREVEGAQYLPAEAAFFRDVVTGVVREQRRLDPLVDQVLAQGWPLKRIEAILRTKVRRLQKIRRAIGEQPRSIVELAIHEGRNRIVRRLLDEVGHPVRRLTRTVVGPVVLRGLQPGEHRELTSSELGQLLDAAEA